MLFKIVCSKRRKELHMTKQNSFMLMIINAIVILIILSPINTEAAIKMPDGSVIANIPIEGKTESEVKQLLENEVANWQAGDDLLLTSDFEQYAVPRDLFEFDIDTTLTKFNEQTKRTLASFFMRKKNVHIPLQVQIKDDHKALQALSKLNYINVDKTVDHLITIVSQLEESDASIVYMKDKEIPLETITELEIEIPELSDAVLTYAIDKLNDHVIKAGDTFSFLQTVTFPEALLSSTKETSFLATALYNLFLQTNFEILERHANETVPSYTKAGQDVLINVLESKDLIVKNLDNTSYEIKVTKSKGQLQMPLKGMPQETTYEYKTKKLNEIGQRTLYRYSKKLNPGEQEIIQQGQSGLTVEVYRNSFAPDKTLLTSERISKDVYLPIPKIVLVSTSEDVPENQLENEADEENIDEVFDELDRGLSNLEEALESNENGTSHINIVPIDQLLEIQDQLQDLFAKIADLEEKFTTYELTMEEEAESYEKKFKELKEELDDMIAEKIFEYHATNEGN